MRRCPLCTMTKGKKKKGRKKHGQGERAACSCFACTGGLLWEKELTGRRSAASSSQTTAAQKQETSWGCRHTSLLLLHLSLHLSASSFQQTDTCDTHPPAPTLPQPLWVTRTCEVSEEIACARVNTQNKPRRSFDEMCDLFCLLRKVFMRINYQLFIGNEILLLVASNCWEKTFQLTSFCLSFKIHFILFAFVSSGYLQSLCNILILLWRDTIYFYFTPTTVVVFLPNVTVMCLISTGEPWLYLEI